jgi:hypothetical protein
MATLAVCSHSQPSSSGCFPTVAVGSAMSRAAASRAMALMRAVGFLRVLAARGGRAAAAYSKYYYTLL